MKLHKLEDALEYKGLKIVATMEKFIGISYYCKSSTTKSSLHVSRINSSCLVILLVLFYIKLTEFLLCSRLSMRQPSSDIGVATNSVVEVKFVCNLLLMDSSSKYDLRVEIPCDFVRFNNKVSLWSCWAWCTLSFTITRGFLLSCSRA